MRCELRRLRHDLIYGWLFHRQGRPNWADGEAVKDICSRIKESEQYFGERIPEDYWYNMAAEYVRQCFGTQLLAAPGPARNLRLQGHEWPELRDGQDAYGNRMWWPPDLPASAQPR